MGDQGEQRGALLTELFQSTFHLAKEVGSLPVPPLNPASLLQIRAHCCRGKGHLLCMGHTYTQGKEQSEQMWPLDKEL